MYILDKMVRDLKLPFIGKEKGNTPKGPHIFDIYQIQLFFKIQPILMPFSLQAPKHHSDNNLYNLLIGRGCFSISFDGRFTFCL